MPQICRIKRTKVVSLLIVVLLVATQRGSAASAGQHEFDIGASLTADAVPDLLVGPDRGTVASRALSGVDGTELAAGFPFGPAFAGGVRLASADVSGDGVNDIIAAMGPGGGLVRVIDGVNASEVFSGYPFGADYTGGVFVAAADVDGDGRADVLVGQGAGGIARAYSGANVSLLFGSAPFGADYSGGVHVAAGDVDGDGRADLVFGQATGGLVSIFNGATGSLIVSAPPFGGTFTAGVFVAAGDVNGDGRADIIVSPATGNGPVVVVDVSSRTALGQFTPYDATNAGGVRIAAADFDGDGRAEVITAPGPGAMPLVRVYRGGSLAPYASLFAFAPDFTGGVFVAAPVATRVRFDSAASAVFTVGQAGQFSIHANFTPTITMTGAVPPGVMFADHGNGTATLEGTPTGAGGIFPLTFSATNAGTVPATQAFTLTVHKAPAITSANTTTFALGTAGSFTVTSTGFPVPALTVTGALPAGVRFVSDPNGTAILAGNPTEDGTFPLTITAANGVSTAAIQAFVLTVPPPRPPLVCAPPMQTVSLGQSANVTATGGTGTYAWSAPGSATPTGAGAAFGTSYATAGTKTLTVTSGAQTTSCTVIVSPPGPVNSCVGVTASVLQPLLSPNGSVLVTVPTGQQANIAIASLDQGTGIVTNFNYTLGAGSTVLTVPLSCFPQLDVTCGAVLLDSVSGADQCPMH